MNAPRQAVSDIDRTLQWATGAVNSGRGEDAERLAREVLAQVPQHATALHILGCALLLRGRAAEAIVPLEKAARARQDPAIETQLAIALRQTGRADDALARVTRAAKRRPAHAEAFHELGFQLFTRQRPDDAIAAIEHGLEAQPRLGPAWRRSQGAAGAGQGQGRLCTRACHRGGSRGCSLWYGRRTDRRR